MAAVLTIPDLEPIIIEQLQADTALTVLVDPKRIATFHDPGDSRTWLLVTRSGGASLVRGHLAQVAVTFHCLGTTRDRTSGRAEAGQLANEACRAVEALTGARLRAVQFAAVDIVTLPAFIPDIAYPSPRARYVFVGRFTVHPTT